MLHNLHVNQSDPFGPGAFGLHNQSCEKFRKLVISTRQEGHINQVLFQ
jgi:hypothetical protein